MLGGLELGLRNGSLRVGMCTTLWPPGGFVAALGASRGFPGHPCGCSPALFLLLLIIQREAGVVCSSVRSLQSPACSGVFSEKSVHISRADMRLLVPSPVTLQQNPKAST